MDIFCELNLVSENDKLIILGGLIINPICITVYIENARYSLCVLHCNTTVK